MSCRHVCAYTRMARDRLREPARATDTQTHRHTDTDRHTHRHRHAVRHSHADRHTD